MACDLLGDHGRRAAWRRAAAWVQRASSVVPSTRKASTELMTTRVWRAWTEAGRRKLPTPLEMASRPVSDEPPLANERRRVMKASPISQPVARCPEMPPEELAVGRERDVVQVAQGLLDVADDDDRGQRDHVEVGREGEEPPGLADAAQVAVEEEQHDADGDGHRVEGVGQARDGTGQVGRAGRRLHGHRDRVVDQQRHRGDLGHPRPEVVPGHHVGAAGLRVVLDHVEVRQGHEEEDAENGQGDRDTRG